MPTRLGRRAVLAPLFVLGFSARAGAQTSDSTNSWPQRVWAFAGVGRGSIERSLAGTIGVSYAPGPLLFTFRRSGAAQWFGDSIGESAFLVGLRTHGSRAFVSGQLGVSLVNRSHTCDCSGGDWTGPTRSALAFDLAAQTNYVVAGIGVDAFGAVSPSGYRYAGVALIVQLGWFGE